ncbi:MAG: VWA domain-containing protein [Blastocatellia bacterium]
MYFRIMVRVLVLCSLSLALLAHGAAQSGRPRRVGESNGQTGPQTAPPKPGESKQPAQEPQDPAEVSGAIRVETTLVTIPVSVLDRDNRFVPGLKQKNFRLYENNVEQEITDFADVEVPFNVVLLLDTSRSTRFKIEDMQGAAISFVNALRPHDRMMVVSFDREIFVDSEFTSDRDKLRRAISGTKTGSSTRLYDALDLVLTERLAGVDGRKAIVLFSDGEDTESHLASARGVLQRVEESGALVYPVQYTTGDPVFDPFGRGRGGNRPPVWTGPRFPGGGGRGRRPFPFFSSLAPQQYPQGGRNGGFFNAGEFMRELASRSGGRLFPAETIRNAEEAFARIAEELRHQYAVGYYPANTARDGSFRRIRVVLDQPGLIVRARDGYRAAEK